MNPKHTPASERGLTLDYVSSRLSYDPVTGVLTWKTGQYAGRAAGTRNINGAIQIGLDGVLYLAHKLAWFISYGKWPEQQIDHRNGVRWENWLGNLRDVSQSINMQNVRAATRRNRLGVLGVRQSRNGRFQAILRIDGRPKGLGAYDTAEEAHSVYLAAKRRHHPGCTI